MHLWIRKCFTILVLEIKDEFLRLNVSVSKYNSGLFYHFKDTKLPDFMVCFVEDNLWGGRNEFKKEVIGLLSKIFVIGSQFSKVFAYLGTEINQNKGNSVIVSQESYAYFINTISFKRSVI